MRQALEQEKLYDPFQQLEILAELSQEFAGTLDIQEALDQVVEKIIEHMGAEAASIFLLDSETDMLVCRASSGPVDVRGVTVEKKQGIVGRAVSENCCQLVKDVRLDDDFAGVIDAKTGFETRSSVCSPLKTPEGVIGVIQVLNKQGGNLFDERDRDVLRVLSTPISLAIHNARMAMSLVEQKRIKRELELARNMQRSLLPKRRRPPYPIVGVNMPAREVSGDFYDFFDLADGRIGFTVGDVSGKGVDASLLMVRATTLLRWTGKQGLAPAEWLATVNAELNETVSRGMFVCAVAGYYNPLTGVLEWANAGFPPALKLNRDGNFEQILATAPPLAVLPEILPECEQTHMDNSTIMFFSDGVIEAEDKEGNELGIDGLEGFVRDVRESSPAQRMGALVARLRQMKLGDDTTLLLIEDRNRWEEVLLEFGFAADPVNLAMLRAQLREQLELLDTTQHWVDQLLLVANEACANIIRHAYDGDESGKILFSLSLDNNNLSLVFRDYAQCVNTDCIQPRDLGECRPGGLGINIIDSLMDEWGFQRLENEGNLLIMRKSLLTLKGM